MQFLREHIIYKILAFTLAWAILIPTAVKFTHAFNHYKHEVCLGEKTTHLHKLDIDCKFYDFKINTPFLLTTENIDLLFEISNFKISNSLYTFLNNHRPLSFSLRGPPELV
ncbi:MAG: hypothetical protein K9I95_05020 [Flavobacteriaceae bacterium]|jgi:hypothetical protein|nr:hypothetical protein [Flavobacteriaceae bacterium]